MNLPTDTAPPLMALRYAPGTAEAGGRRDDDTDARGFGNASVGGGFASAFAANLAAERVANAPAATDAPMDGVLDNLIDVVNPLQHVPVVSALYRSATDDAISAPARLLGGALFGGPIGLGLAVANVVTEAITDEDIGEHIVAALTPNANDAPGTPAALAGRIRDNDAPSEAEENGTAATAETGAGTEALAQYAHVKDWAEAEARFRAEARRARGTGTHAGLRTPDSFVENALLSGAMKAAMKEYDQLATNQRRDDHIAMELDLES